ncbi:MAG: DUF4350 domain-containing protein [Gemmatimonadota bacterium]
MNGSRQVLRIAGAAILAFSGLTCSLRDDATGPGAPALTGLMVSPVLPPNFSRFAVGLGIEQIHLTLQGQQRNVLIDTVIAFAATSPSITIRLPLVLASTSESLLVDLSYETLAGVQLFTGQQTVVVHAGTPTIPPQIPILYVGPGANVYYLYVTPSDSIFSFGDTAFFDVQAYDSSNQLVSGVYINWQSDDPSVVVDAQGRLPVPGTSGSAVIYAQTPNGSYGASLVYFSKGQVALTPDSVEMIPGRTQYFNAYGGTYGSYAWTVNGIPGGDAVVGTVDMYGTYNAPSQVPIPSTVSVCASVAADTTCSRITLTSPPTPGGDLVALGDTYLLTDAALSAQSGNRTLGAQLVNYSGTGARTGGRTVIFDRGRSAPCLSSGLCADSALNSLTAAITGAGYTIQRVDTASVYRNIPSAVKVIFLWNPSTYLSDRETNELKRFAREGGRIVLVADDTTSLGGSLSNSLNASNDVTYRLISGGMSFSYTDAACGTTSDITGAGIQSHQSTTGVATVTMDCGTEISPSNNGYPLLIINQQTVGATAKVDPSHSVNYGG